jgi:archaellum component FlaG (FlaF/FlaG flagellin family)
MGFSLTLSHIIMVIASVCLASLFSAYAFYTGNLVQNELAQNINNYKITVNIRLEIVYATINDTTTPPHFVIYAKNTGNLPFSDFTSLDVYVGEYGKAQLYTYSKTATPWRRKLQHFNGRRRQRLGTSRNSSHKGLPNRQRGRRCLRG